MAPPAPGQPGPIEAKVAVGSFTGILTGLLTWALVSYIPAFRSGLPPAVAALIPVTVAWLFHTAAAWAAPHTPRAVPPIPGIRPPGDAPVKAQHWVDERTYSPVPPSTGTLPDPPAPGGST